MLRKLTVILLSLLLVLSFVSCGKDKDNSSTDGSSSNVTSGDNDPTQDWDDDEWTEGSKLTESEREELEDLWNDLKENGGAEITSSDASTSKNSSTQSSSSDNSSSNSSSQESSAQNSSSQDSSSQSSSELNATITSSVNALF